MMKVLYFSDAGPQLSVFASQVLGMVNAWRKVADVDLVYRQKGEVSDAVDGRPLKQIGSLSRTLLGREIVLNDLPDLVRNYDLVHCRGAITTWMVLKALGKHRNRTTKTLFDCRGLLVEEMGMSPATIVRNPLSLVRYYEYRAVEKYAVSHCDFFTTVSRDMSEHFKRKHKRAADRVIPCIVNDTTFAFSPERRAEIRNRLGIGAERVFLYVGGTDPWQRLDILGGWWGGHVKRHPRDVMLVLTKSQEKFMQALQLNGSDIPGRIICEFVPHDDVPGYMCAADYGMMFRDETIVNRVACPVKLGEYLATGLTVLSNQDYLAARDPESILLVNPDDGLPGDMREKDDHQRRSDSERAARMYSGENAVQNICEML